MSVYMPIVINDVKTRFLVDTGAEVTILSLHTFKRIPKALRPKLRKPDNKIKLEVADDGVIEAAGWTTILMHSGDKQFEWDVLVAPISDGGLLGMDFLSANSFVFSNEGLRLNGLPVKTEISEALTRARRVTVKHKTVIPANSEIVIEGDTGCRDMMSENAVLEPFSSKPIKKALLLASCLIDTTRKDISIPVRLLNMADKDIVLAAGFKVGYLKDVNSVTMIDECENNVQDIVNRVTAKSVHFCDKHKTDVKKTTVKPDCTWSEALTEMFEKNAVNLLPEQREQLKYLLNKHVNLFAKSSDDLGQTSVITHEIDTGDAKPIKQQPRRPPREFEKDEKKIIDAQLKANIVQESTSSWASPLVYVRKKDGSVRTCIDYRRLNAVTKKDAYPLPRTSDCLDCLSGAKYFSTLDLQSGFH